MRWNGWMTVAAGMLLLPPQALMAEESAEPAPVAAPQTEEHAVEEPAQLDPSLTSDAAQVPESEAAPALLEMPSEPSDPSAALSESAAPLVSQADVQQLCEQFLNDMVAGRYEAAFHALRPYFPVSEAKFDHLKTETRRQLELAEEQFGTPIGWALGRSDLLGETALRLRYLQKFENDVIYWDLVFYKPREAWLLNGLGFDDDIPGLFK